MKVKKLMTENPAFCTPEMALRDVAHLMVEFDCGAIPVVEDAVNKKPVGMITDRDIVTNSIAAGKNALAMTAAEIMTFPARTVRENAKLDECVEQMEEEMIRRMIVVDESGALRGIVSQADIALRGDEELAGELLKDVSKAHKAWFQRP